jgi:hypothetical protein
MGGKKQRGKQKHPLVLSGEEERREERGRKTITTQQPEQRH